MRTLKLFSGWYTAGDPSLGDLLCEMLLQMPLLPAGKSSSTIESEAHSVTKFGVIVQVETVRATPAGANRNGVRNFSTIKPDVAI